MIFENIAEVNRNAEGNREVLRISLDTKAKVKIGDFSRNGKSRLPEAAADHDMNPDNILVPLGILEVTSGRFTIIFGISSETTDFIADGLEFWWNISRERFSHIKELIINEDNSPHLSSRRTQFIRRLIEFSDKTGLKIRLVYYPPYHSKYNPVERCWGILEKYWNGTILNSIEKTVKWAGNMKWRGMKPDVHILDKAYKKGVKVSKKIMKTFEKRLKRSQHLPKWDVTIEPVIG